MAYVSRLLLYISLSYFPVSYIHDRDALSKPDKEWTVSLIHATFNEPIHVTGPLDLNLSKTHSLQDSSSESTYKYIFLNKVINKKKSSTQRPGEYKGVY